MLQICREKQRQLSQQYQQGTLAHALIIQGVAGSGNEVLGQWLIDLLICQKPTQFIDSSFAESGGPSYISEACEQCKTCLLRKTGNYPDHLLLTSENKTLGVDDIRRGNAFLEKTAQLGKVKTILIPQAQAMTVAAANALLKTLEEPSDNSYIVLIAEDLESLLPTIVSRCAVFSIRPKVGEALLSQLKGLNTNSLATQPIEQGNTSAHAFVNISQLPELTDNEVFNVFTVFNQTLLDYLYTGVAEEKLLAQLIDNKHGIRWLEKIIVNLIRQHYLIEDNELSDEAVEQRITIDVLNQIYQTIIKSNKLLKLYSQANRQFVGEQLLMMINNIVKP
ncbi:hypothetical protein [Colwellia echini]|uniref:DNA-directed DNA polymerase n=1 Tax=Colwellia echini TaxID=1982103 RepID=A0ABY3MZX9_9GAMM|nr:hypothetical protein [Colwellia echini]TYK66795.1 DNA polymerase III subunit delta' [Colwellia echini]